MEDLGRFEFDFGDGGVDGDGVLGRAEGATRDEKADGENEMRTMPREPSNGEYSGRKAKSLRVFKAATVTTS
jgi:hypothetical protein